MDKVVARRMWRGAQVISLDSVLTMNVPPTPSESDEDGS
jgi:hypothetical protein